jgi:hypothetical protein
MIHHQVGFGDRAMGGEQVVQVVFGSSARESNPKAAWRSWAVGRTRDEKMTKKGKPQFKSLPVIFVVSRSR